MSQGGSKKAKRMRTTRAAYSAMEGGQRSTTRAERWFKADINTHLVMATGGKDWTRVEDVSDEADVATNEPAGKRGKKSRARVIVDDDSSDGQDHINTASDDSKLDMDELA